jgi:hypothetical protein
MRITRITLETEATLTILWRADSDQGHSERFRCSRCGLQAAILESPEAATAFRAGLRDLCGDDSPERIHIEKLQDGSNVVCLDSLRRAVPQLTGKSLWQIQPDKENAP